MTFYKLAILLLAAPILAVQYNYEDSSFNQCSSCASGGSGGECTYNMYYHDAVSGFSCGDTIQPFVSGSSCSASGELSTPFGRGNWQAASSCASGKGGGNIVGNGFSCECARPAQEKNNAQACGDLEYACNSVFTCLCEKPYS